MPSEVAIREAAKDRIIAVTITLPVPPTVIHRDILNLFDLSWMSLLRDADEIVHGWTITQNGAVPTEERIGGAEYDLYFDVWQWTEYRTGSNASNSENTASTERELVIDAFKDATVLVPALSRAKPLSFPPGSIITPVVPDFRGQVKLAKGLLVVGKVYGCEEE